LNEFRKKETKQRAWLTVKKEGRPACCGFDGQDRKTNKKGQLSQISAREKIISQAGN